MFVYLTSEIKLINRDREETHFEYEPTTPYPIQHYRGPQPTFIGHTILSIVEPSTSILDPSKLAVQNDKLAYSCININI